MGNKIVITFFARSPSPKLWCDYAKRWACLLPQIMKNIFHQSFNVYKTDIEPRLNDLTLHNMQCSRRLFEIQLSHRHVSAAYIEGDNVAVTVEGEAARVLNLDTGLGGGVGGCRLSGCRVHVQWMYLLHA